MVRNLGYSLVSEHVKKKLKQEHKKLNPLILKREIDLQLKKVFDIQQRHGIPKITKELR